MNLLLAPIWDPQQAAYVGDLFLEDSAPMLSVSPSLATLGDVWKQAGPAAVLASTVAVRPTLIWPQTGVEAPYNGVVHSIRWWSPLEIANLNNRSGSTSPKNNSPTLTVGVWALALGAAAFILWGATRGVRAS